MGGTRSRLDDLGGDPERSSSDLLESRLEFETLIVDLSSMFINLLAEAGFTNVYNIVDGMEGGIVKDPESFFNGRRMKNGWQNSNLPWTYEINLDQIWIPNDPSSQEKSK